MWQPCSNISYRDYRTNWMWMELISWLIHRNDDFVLRFSIILRLCFMSVIYYVYFFLLIREKECCVYNRSKAPVSLGITVSLWVKLHFTPLMHNIYMCIKGLKCNFFSLRETVVARWRSQGRQYSEEENVL
jgi:hypothetical protein